MQLITPIEIAFLTTTVALLAILACGTYIESTKTRLWVHASLAFPAALFLAQRFGLLWPAILLAVLAVSNLTVWLLMRNFERDRETRAAYWQAAGALAGTLARQAARQH